MLNELCDDIVFNMHSMNPLMSFVAVVYSVGEIVTALLAVVMSSVALAYTVLM